MKDLLKEVEIRLLYLTPIGYILDFIYLYSGIKTPGVFVDFKYVSPIRVYIKENPTLRQRIEWFINGTILLIQAVFIFYNQLGGDWGFVYAWPASIFGAVSVVSALFPEVSWNRTLFNVNPRLAKILIILAIAALTVFSYLFAQCREYNKSIDRACFDEILRRL